MAARKVLLVTPTEFWELGAGARVHVLALVRHLSAITELTAVYLGPDSEVAPKMLAHLGIRCAFVAFGARPQVTLDDYRRRLADLCAAQRFDACIVDRIDLTFLLQAVPPRIKTFLNTHDIVSDAAESMRRFGAATGKELDAAREFALFRLYDVVMAIQEYDYDKIRAQIGDDRTILLPYPALSSKKELRATVGRIGFVASAWRGNLDGVGWFAAEVWPRVRRPGVELGLYGWIGDHWKDSADRGIVAHGFQPDLESVYRDIDIVINPVRYGAGLKIKTVEALGNGLPLVTTREGARGLDALAGRAFLMADDAAGFAACLDRLIHDRGARVALGDEGYRFAQAHLSPEACYAALVREIDRPKGSARG